MQRQDSAGSGGAAYDSAAGSQGSERRQDQEDGDASTELLTQQGGLQEALFGVLHKLCKEPLVEGWRFALSAMVINYLQLAVFFIGHNFPWTLDFEACYWKWLSWVRFPNLLPEGLGLFNGHFDLYVGLFLVLVGVLLLFAAGCVFLGIKSKASQSHHAWLIDILRVIVAFFCQLCYINTLGTFAVSLDCTFSSPTIANELLLLVMAYFLAVADCDLNPTSSDLSAQAHSRSARWRFALISLLTFINQVFPSYTKIQAIACIIITTYLCYMYVRYMPFRTAWVNGLQASFFASLSWASFLIVLMAFFFQSSDKLAFTVLLWAGLLVVVPMVWGVLYLRVRHAHRVALMYRMGLKAVSGPVIHKFIDELEVEVVARCGCIRDQWGDLIPAWVDTAEAVYKAGLAQFPDSPYLTIAYSSFLIQQRRALQAGVGLLEVARRLEPNIGERYMLFSRDREQKQRSGSMAGGSGDLLSYVEFQNSLKALMDVHRQALTANRSFWRLVVRKDVSFGDLTAALAAMDAAEKRADNMFIMVLDRYPNSPKLLQAYALYLESVKSNPARASRYRAEADRLEKEANKAPQPSALTDGTEGMGESGTDNRSLGALVDDSNDAVVVSNAGGILQFVNKKALELFGYKQGELEGKNVRVLMPPPYSAQHNQYIHRYKKTGKALRMGKPASQTVALNAQGFSFPVSLAIKQLQRGDAKAFMGVFKPVQEDIRVAILWLNSAGNILALNRGFHDVCGYSLADVRGEAVGSLGTDEGMGKQFKHITEMLRDWQYNAAELDTTRHTFEVSLRHKYGAAVPVSGSASYAGTESVRLIVLRFVRDERVEKLGLVSLTPAGQVVYVNASMETMLGYEPGFLASKKLTIKDLVRPPYSQLGVRWMQQAGQSSDSSAMAPTSCRTGRIVLLSGRNNKQVPVRLQVVEAQVGTVSCFTATATEVEVPEADAWGGGDTKDVWNNSKRMQMLVHADGRVLAVRADPTTALQGFGQDLTELSGKYITEVVQDFAKPAGVQHGWPSGPQLLSRLADETARVQAARGSASFRVGLMPSVAAAKQLKRGSKGAALAAAAAIPCRMVVLPVGDTDLDVQGLVDEGTVKEEDVADGGQLHVVKLRQDSMLEAVLEIDSHLKIKAADVESTYLFGTNALKGRAITRFIKHPGLVRSTARAEDFLAVKRTQLKRGGDQAVGEKLEMEALHVDGSRMLVQLQGADKHGDGSRWVVRVTVHPAQPSSWVRPSLLEELSRCGAAAAAASPKSSRSNSPEPEDIPIAAITRLGVAGKAQSADGRSEHSVEDGTSNNDGASAVDPEESEMRGNGGDYQRAKRLRKLNKLLTSPKAQKTVRTLARASVAICCLLLGVHAVFFGLTIEGIKSQNSFFTEVVNAGTTIVSACKMMTIARILVASTDVTNPHGLPYMSPATAASYLQYYDPFMVTKAATLEAMIEDVMFGSNRNKLTMPPTDEQQMLLIGTLGGINVKQLSPSRQYNTSLWDLSQRYLVAGRLLAAAAVTPAARTLSNNTELTFMGNNYNALSNGLLQNLGYQTHVSKLKLQQQTKDIIIFLACEAGGLIPICCLVLYVLLTLVNRARLRLFNTFLAVPRPVALQLATKEVQVSLEDDQEGDDEDGEAWMRQQQQQQQEQKNEQGGSGSGLGFNLSAPKRKLRTTGLATYVMLAPIVLWGIVVCITYSISMARLQGSTASVSNVVASNLLHYYTSTAFNKAVGMALASTTAQVTQYRTQLAANYPYIQSYVNGLLYGSINLDLDGALKTGNKHEQLWFGHGCLSINASDCLPTTNKLYQATRNGLNQLVNLFVLNCADFAGAPPAAVSIMNPYFQFLWNVAREGGSLDDGLLTNTADFVSDGQGRMAIITALQVAALVVGVILIIYFHFYQLTPYLRRVKKETRRVAELLSQLPSEVDVAQLVLDSTDVQQEEDRHRHHLRKQGAPNAGLVGALGRLLGSCLGRGKAWVSPAAHQASGSEAAKLSIVVSQNTSKDNEAVSPQPGAHDVSRKVKAYKEQMHRHHSDGDGDRDDPSLWDSHRTPRKISFAFPT